MEKKIQITDNCLIVHTNGCDYIQSYGTLVARINYTLKSISVLEWTATPKATKSGIVIENKKINHSRTTSRHINRVAEILKYKVYKTF